MSALNPMGTSPVPNAPDQTELLRFLEDHSYLPLGAERPVRADVRVIAASNGALRALAAQGAFRRDLLFRLDVMNVTLPALRDRDGDVVLLAEHFLDIYSAQYRKAPRPLCPRTRSWLDAQPWPGNVRELENLVHRMVLLSDGPLIEHTLACGGKTDCGAATANDLTDSDLGSAKAAVVDRFEREYLHRLMTETGGNITHAARRARKDRRALARLLKKYDIDRRRYAGAA